MNAPADRAPLRKPWSRRARRIVDSFMQACASVDTDGIARLMRPDAALTIDSGGSIPGPHCADGPDAVATAITELLIRYPGFRMEPGHINGRPGIVMVSDGRVVGVINAVRRGRRVQEMWIVVNPDKLRHWNAM